MEKAMPSDKQAAWSIIYLSYEMGSAQLHPNFGLLIL